MNGRNEKLVLVVLLCLFAFNSCRTVTSIDTSKTDEKFIDVIDSQTEVITSGKEIENTIDDIKVITDDAKATGEIPKDKVHTIIKYVDLSSEQIKDHNEKIKVLIGKITDLERSRITDNLEASKLIADKQTEIDKSKIKASIFFKWALIATVLALVLAGILWLPKLLKLIL